MVIADDERRFVAANAAACLLFRLTEEEILRLRIDDLTPPDGRAYVQELWSDFIDAGLQEGVYDLQMPDGASVRVEYSATANVEPGRHLSVLVFPPSAPTGEPDPVPEGSPLLTSREREILAMVAMGRSTSWIAVELGISASTVETHVRHCLEKLGARNRAHAIALGLQRQEIRLDLEPAHPGIWG